MSRKLSTVGAIPASNADPSGDRLIQPLALMARGPDAAPQSGLTMSTVSRILLRHGRDGTAAGRKRMAGSAAR